MIRIFIALIATAFFASVGLSQSANETALGQDGQVTAKGTSKLAEVMSIPQGSYERFGTWQQIQLGATALVKPSVAKKAYVVFSYHPSSIIGDAYSAAMKKAISGELVVAIGSSQDGEYVAWEKSGTAALQGALATKKFPYIKVLSLGKLANAKPDGKMITWQDVRSVP